MRNLRLYTELASWWPLLSAPREYEQEAALYAEVIEGAVRGPAHTLLELGSGGGNNASYLKKRFAMTLVDLSPDMLAVSRKLNPECEHIEGDMRTVRLGRTFDAVFVHDAIMYLTTESDFTAAVRTCADHVRPGGIVLLVPDATQESFRPRTEAGGDDGEGRAIRYLEWDHQSEGTSFTSTFVYVLKEDGMPLRVEHEEHAFGLFARETWLRVMRDAGLEPRAIPDPLRPEVDGLPSELFLGGRL